jgi:tetratricopeptide (TPR) repeat protein
MRIQFIVAALVWSLAPQAWGQTLRNAEYKAATDEGIDYLFRLEHDNAIQFFADLGAKRPDHPGPPLAEAAAYWLRELFARQELDLDEFISPGYFTRPPKRMIPAADRLAFERGIAKSQALAREWLQTHPGDKDARYYLGAAEGAQGAFAFTIDQSYLAALRHGKAAYQYQQALVEEDPEFWDSYLTVGTYEYTLGNIPWYLKWITTIAGYKGSEARGFEYLVLTADKAMFVRNEARVMLMVLYVREGYHDYALRVARELHRRYPENFLLHLNQAQILERMGRREDAIETYLEVVRLAEQGRKNYQKVPLGTFRYTAGARLAELGERERALALFLKATQDPGTPEREKALSHLRAGEILDLLGQRAEAVSQYHVVQGLTEFEGSHEFASKYLDSPYAR